MTHASPFVAGQPIDLTILMEIKGSQSLGVLGSFSVVPVGVLNHDESVEAGLPDTEQDGALGVRPQDIALGLIEIANRIMQEAKQ